MLTEKGNQVLSELRSELDSEIDTSIWPHIFNDLRATLTGTMHYIDKFLMLLSLYTGICIFITFLFVDEKSIDSLRLATNHDIWQMLSLYCYVILFLAVTSTFALAFLRARAFSCSKSEMENQAIAKVQTTKEQIELIEEVLFRHQLIKKASK